MELTSTCRDTAGRPIGGWFTRKVLGRVYTKNNVLGIITGETGSGKSYMGLRFCEKFDPDFDSSRIVFNMKEFLDLITVLPEKSFILFDECGIEIGHRTWLSSPNQAINMVSQSFRHKYINVFFTLPSRFYLDKVPREMCHYEIMMKRRGVGAVYRIRKSGFVDRTFTKYIGHVYSGLPSEKLCQEYEKMRSEHQEALYEKLRLEQEVMIKKHDEKIERALRPARTIQEDVEKGVLLLPQIIDFSKDSDQGLINVHKLRKAFDTAGIKLAHNRSYNIRKELLQKLHANNDQLLNKLKKEK